MNLSSQPLAGHVTQSGSVIFLLPLKKTKLREREKKKGGAEGKGGERKGREGQERDGGRKRERRRRGTGRWSHHPKVKSAPILINNLFISANKCDLISTFLSNQSSGLM